jgi:hypothetical protein
MADQTYDIVIVGASLGGVAAALRAGAMGASVCLIEAGTWVGGQFSSQGVCRPDENAYVSTVGATVAYQSFRHDVRAFYRNNFRLSATGQQQPTFNPGGAYPGFATHPSIADTVLTQKLQALANVHLRTNTQVSGVQSQGDTVVSLTASTGGEAPVRYLAKVFLDATDLGDLLPLANVECVQGAESAAQTGEAGAPDDPQPNWIQPITLVLAVEHRPAGENNTIEPPSDYAQLKAEQSYGINDGVISSMFGPGENMFNYRQFIDASNFDDPSLPYDLTTINTGSVDYQAASLPTGSAAGDAALIARARRVSLGYLYWLQTECPRTDGRAAGGYPELRLRADIFGTPDGTAPAPYIRESRRIKALKFVARDDIEKTGDGPRARLFADSCGIGYYPMDVHAARGEGLSWFGADTWPFQIPLGALVPVRVTNLLAACKNLGTTHFTNGAYRIHPTEWNVGESAGALAAFSIARGVAPRNVVGVASLLQDFQHALLAAGVPLFWWTDVYSTDAALYSAVNMLGVRGIVSGYDDMSYRPNAAIDDEFKLNVESNVGQSLNWPSAAMTRGQAAKWLVQQLGY